jgi:hypothetical protein
MPTRVYTQQDRDEFAFWFSLPLKERKSAGHSTIQEYADNHDIDPKTLWRWRQDPLFTKLTDHLRQKWGQDMTASVMDGWKLACEKGNPLAIELWLAYFHDFTRKTALDVNEAKKNEYGVNDIRSIIDTLPEGLRQKHNGYLRELLDDLATIERARSYAEPGSDAGPVEGPVQGYAGENAPSVPSEAANAMAESDPGSVRKDMERKVYPRHNESAARRGQEQTPGNAGV